MLLTTVLQGPSTLLQRVSDHPIIIAKHVNHSLEETGYSLWFRINLILKSLQKYITCFASPNNLLKILTLVKTYIDLPYMEDFFHCLKHFSEWLRVLQDASLIPHSIFPQRINLF